MIVMEWNWSGSIKERRVRYAGVFLLMLFAEVFIALFIKDRFIRPYVGDILVVILIYFAVRVAVPVGCRLLPVYVFLFAVLVEVLQYFHFAEVLGVEDVPVLKTILGSTFDWKDIVCYALGGLGLEIYQWARRFYEREGF